MKYLNKMSSSTLATDLKKIIKLEEILFPAEIQGGQPSQNQIQDMFPPPGVLQSASNLTIGSISAIFFSISKKKKSLYVDWPHLEILLNYKDYSFMFVLTRGLMFFQDYRKTGHNCLPFEIAV